MAFLVLLKSSLYFIKLIIEFRASIGREKKRRLSDTFEIVEVV